MELCDIPDAKLVGWRVQALNRAGAPMPLMEVEAEVMFSLITELQAKRAALARVQAFIDYPYRNGELTPEQYHKISEALSAIIADE